MNDNISLSFFSLLIKIIPSIYFDFWYMIFYIFIFIVATFIVIYIALDIRKIPISAGSELIVGRKGIVIGFGRRKTLKIELDGEIWKAKSDRVDLAIDDEVAVIKRDGLILIVE